MKKLSEIMKTIEASKKEVEFMPTGFPKMDEFLDGGFMRKELIVLGGYTGVGKSFVASKIFFNISQKGFKCAYFSLEISNETIGSRLIGMIANIKPTRIIAGLLTKEEFNNKIKAKASLLTFDNFMYFYDDIFSYQNIEQEVKKEKYEFIVVDFIQNVMALNFKEEYERLSYIALELQKLAKETNSCILVLSQLSNEAARKELMEYKGSGSIITVCDLGFFIRRSKNLVDNNKFEITLRKNRRGISGVDFEFTFRQPGGMII